MQDALSSIVAQHMASAKYADLPKDAIVAAKMSIIDTLGPAFGAIDSPGTDAVLRVCRAEQTSGHSTVWVTGETMAPRQAAFANSVFAAALDFDSVFHAGIVHSDVVVVPTALAVGEAVAASGQELVASIAYGNDLLCRLSLAPTPPRKGWFFTSVFGVVVAAAMTARLLKCDSTQISHAMGLALFGAAGTYQPMTERSSSKQAAAAFAVQAGIQCGYLAAAGFEGVAHPLEGPHGLFGLYQDGDASPVCEALGQKILGVEVGRKPYPSCQGNHAAIEAALAIRQELARPVDEIAEIEVFLSPHACRIVGTPHDATRASRMSAQFSVQYSIACALMLGRLGIAEISQPSISDAGLAELAARVRVIEDPANQHPYVPATVVLRTRDGASFSHTATTNKGGIELPMTDDEMLAKLATCLKFSVESANDLTARDVFLQIMSIDQVRDVAEAIPQICQLAIGTPRSARA